MFLQKLPRLLLHSLPIISALALAVAARGNELPPVSAFIAQPEIRQVKVSPDGKSVVIVTVHDFVDTAVRLDLATMQVAPLASIRNTRVENFWWKGPDRMVYLLRDIFGERRIQIMNLQTGKQEFSGAANRIYDVVNILPSDPDNILVSDYVGSWKEFRGNLKKFNVRTGKSETVEKHPENTYVWLTAKDGQAKAALGLLNEDWFMLTRPENGTGWQKTMLGKQSLPDFTPIAVYEDQRRLVGFDRKADIARVVVRDPVTGTSQLLVQSQEMDPSYTVTWGDDPTHLRGVVFETNRRHTKYLNEADAALAATIEKTLPDAINSIASISADGKKVIVESHSDSQAPTYYIFDRPSRRMSLLGNSFPSLDPHQMGTSRFFHFKAADGLPLTAKILLPPPTGVPPPLIVFIGSDLSERSDTVFSPYLQMFAARGYAVLEVNHRGVEGFGQKHAEAGIEQVNGKMADDLVDGIAYAAKEGWIDDKRVAVFGNYVGGMLGLYALSRHPDAFAVWINFNTPLITRYLEPETFVFGRHEKMGNSLPVSQEFRMRKYVLKLDPASRLKDIRVPSFHFYYTDWTGQPYNDGDKAKSILRKAGLPVTFLIPPIEVDDPNQTEYWQRRNQEYVHVHEELLKFLATYLPPAGPNTPATTPAKSP